MRIGLLLVELARLFYEAPIVAAIVMAVLGLPILVYVVAAGIHFRNGGSI